jgi:excisionase family DNA binding protein
VDRDAADEAENTLIQAFVDFVRSVSMGERGNASTPQALLSIADAAKYLNVSTSTVRNLAVGGKLRSTRIGDRLRFRREWLDAWVDAGGGDVPISVAPAASSRAPDRANPPPIARPARRQAAPKPKPPSSIQRIGDQELRLLADLGRDRFGPIYTWHIGVRSALCGASGGWQSRLERAPSAYMCPRCLTALASSPDAELARFGVGSVHMMRLTSRAGTQTPIRAGYHTGDGRRTLCGKRDGPWALTEREPRARQCFVCDHRRRWDARDLDANAIVPRPVTPLTVLVDAGPIGPPLRDLLERHPQSLDARHAKEPLTEDVVWSTQRWEEVARTADRIGEFTPPKETRPPPLQRWSTYLISEGPLPGASDPEMALAQLPDWAESIERAMALYAKWARESPRHRIQPRGSSRR